MSDQHTLTIKSLLQADDERMRILRLVSYMGLPDCWVGAGFVRSLVWDHCHGFKPGLISGDVDVAWFGPEGGTEGADKLFEAQLRHSAPDVPGLSKTKAACTRSITTIPIHQR